MSHASALAFQQVSRIGQRAPLEKSHIDVRREYIDVAEGRISETRDGTIVVQQLQHFVPTPSHDLKPLVRDIAQFTRVFFHPHLDGGVALDSAVESEHLCRLFHLLAGFLCGRSGCQVSAPRALKPVLVVSFERPHHWWMQR